MEQNKKLVVILIVIIVIVAIGTILYSLGGLPSFKKLLPSPKVEEKPKVIEENLVIPDTQKIVVGEGRTVTEGAVDVSLVPKTEGEKVIVEKAVLTVKGSYALANAETLKWSSDAKLVFIKSLGAVTLEGKSSQWQLAFSSKIKSKKGYEVIIQADQIVSKKEIDSTAVGAELPKNWYDSDGAIKSLQNLPQFSDATISSVSFIYDLDSKGWFYGLSTSRGVTSIAVR